MIIFTILACVLFSTLYQEFKEDLYEKKTKQMLIEKDEEWKSERY
jgi:hypothetical protein